MATQRESHYDASVNKGVLNIRWFTRELNTRWEAGWRLDQLIELAGDTLMIWERRAPEGAATPGDSTEAAAPAGPPTGLPASPARHLPTGSFGQPPP